jgi:glycosyltransferase involved in cell wall biosynthesis
VNAKYDICIVTHDDVVFYSRYWRAARTFQAEGWRVLVVCIVLGNAQRPAVEDLGYMTIWRVAPSAFRQDTVVKTTRKFIQLLLALPVMMVYLRRANARVYHAQDFVSLVIIALAGIWRRPVVYDSLELFFDRAFKGLPRWIIRLMTAMRPLEQFLAHRSAAVLVTSDSVAERMRATLNIAPPVVIHNAVDLRSLGPPAAVYPRNGRRLIVHSGSLLAGRHLSELVAALVFLPEDVALVLMGSGPLQAELAAQAQTLGVDGRVIWMPPVPVDSVAPTLAQADIGLLLITSSSESQRLSLANKFFEYVAAGLPLVMSGIPESVRMTEQYDLGLICDPTDPQDIARQIERLLEPDNLRRYRANVERARSELNWQVEEQKLVAVYRDLLGPD